MSQRKEKQKRRAAHKNSPPETWYPQSFFDTLQEQAQKNAALSPPPLEAASPIASSVQRGSTVHPLEIALEPAVVIHVMEFFKRGGPATWEIEEARAFGHILASQGDNLLYRSKKPGETAKLFNGLARAVAVLAHLPGGVPLFGKRLDAEQIVAGFVGAEAAKAYISESVKW